MSSSIEYAPLRTFGITRSWALRRTGDRLVSHCQRLCGFVSMQAPWAPEARYVDVADGVHLRLDDDQQVNAVGELLGQPPVQAWAGVSLPPRTPSWLISTCGVHPARRRGYDTWIDTSDKPLHKQLGEIFTHIERWADLLIACRRQRSAAANKPTQ